MMKKIADKQVLLHIRLKSLLTFFSKIKASEKMLFNRFEGCALYFGRQNKFTSWIWGGDILLGVPKYSLDDDLPETRCRSKICWD